MKYKGFIFDADGVVITSEYFSYALSRTYGIPLHDILQLFEPHCWDPIVTGKQNLKDILPHYLKNIGWKYGVEEFLTFWFTHESQIDPRITTLITKLQASGYPCFLATNQESLRFHYMCTQMGFKSMFQNTYASCNLGSKKPDTAFFTQMLEDIQKCYALSSSELLFIDDDAKNVASATSLGITSFLYKEFDDLIQFLDK